MHTIDYFYSKCCDPFGLWDIVVVPYFVSSSSLLCGPMSLEERVQEEIPLVQSAWMAREFDHANILSQPVSAVASPSMVVSGSNTCSLWFNFCCSRSLILFVAAGVCGHFMALLTAAVLAFCFVWLSPVYHHQVCPTVVAKCGQCSLRCFFLCALLLWKSSVSTRCSALFWHRGFMM